MSGAAGVVGVIVVVVVVFVIVAAADAVTVSTASGVELLQATSPSAVTANAAPVMVCFMCGPFRAVRGERRRSSSMYVYGRCETQYVAADQSLFVSEGIAGPSTAVADAPGLYG